MADNVVANPGAGGDTFAADDIGGVKFPRTKLVIGADGVNDGDVDASNPLPVTGTVTATTGGLTDAELRATAVPVSGTVTVQDGGGAITVDGTVELGATALAALETITIASVTAPLPAGSNNIGVVELSATALTALETITVASVTAPLAAGDNNIGNVDVLTLPALPAGTNNIGDVDVLTLPAIPTGTNSIGRVNPEPQTANGLTISRVLSAASTNATSVKASAGQVYTIYAHNINAAVRYLKLYNKASSPTVGTDTPVMTLPIPGNTAGAGFALNTGGMGIAFGTGIALALTTGLADNDTGAVAANEIVVNLLYK